MVFADFKNDIEVIKQRSRVIFKVKEDVMQRDGVGILDYLEAAICSDIDYIYYHYGDDPMTKIVIAECDYKDWMKRIIEDGIEMRLL